MSKDLIKDYWPIEQEAVLLIKTELSEFLQNFKPNRLSFPGLQVGTPLKISLQDTYFDTPSQELGTIQTALRLRKEGGPLLLGVKGRDQWTTSGVSRIEVEEPWSATGVATILHYLDFMGVNLTHPGVPIGSAKPVSILGLMGLNPIQDRSLKRTLWPILDNVDRKICSLGLDVVTLNLSDEQVKYGEIEIELMKRNTFDFTNNNPKICTLNSAKGLEFDVVIMPQMNKDNYYEHPSNLKRIYVGMTRARSELILSYHGGYPTVYLSQIDPNTIDRETN